MNDEQRRARVAEILKSARLPWTGNGTWLRREVKWLCSELLRALDESRAARAVAEACLCRDCVICRSFDENGRPNHKDDCPVAAYRKARTPPGGWWQMSESEDQ
jgi:hypothetical protein